MKCSNCTSINVCKFVADMKSVEEQTRSISVDQLPFSITISCKFFNEDKRTRSFGQSGQQAKYSDCLIPLP